MESWSDDVRINLKDKINILLLEILDVSFFESEFDGYVFKNDFLNEFVFLDQLE